MNSISANAMMSRTWKMSPTIDGRNASMRSGLHTALLITCLATTPVPALAAPAPNEDNCRNAISAGLDALRPQPPGSTPRDEADRQRLLAEMERLVEDSRRQGMTECQTWTKMMGKAFNQ
jgi:hypothetical protein